MNHKTIMYTSGGGNLLSQLINLAHFIAFELESEYKFIVFDLAFSPYAKYFSKNTRVMKKIPFTTKNNFSSFLYTSESKFAKLLRKQSIRMIHWSASINQHIQSIIVGDISNHYSMLYGQQLPFLNLEKEKTKDLFNKKRITYLAGAPIRCWKYVKKNANDIRDEIKFNDQLTSTAYDNINSIRNNYEILIGVFVSSSIDKYNYDSSNYLNWMNQLEAYFNDKKVGFLIISDILLNNESFNKSNYHVATNESLDNDLLSRNFIELSICDYIFSPPSSFSAWAAFFGKIPLIIAHNRTQIVSKRDFLNDNIFDALKNPEFSEVINK